MPPTYLAVVLIVSAFLPPSLAQYGPPAVKGKKHRTTTTTPLPPDIQGINLGQAYPGYNPISSTPLPDNSLGSYNPPPQDGGSYWWQNPNSPFSGATAPAPGPSPAPQPQPQPQPGYPGSCGAGGAGGCGSTPQQPVNIQGNPFLSGLKPGGGAVPPIQPTGQTITCSGPGNVCVPKNQCSNGVVVTDGRGSFDVRSEVQYCDAVSQACCRVPSGGNRPSGGCGGYGSGAGCGQPAQQPSPYPGQPAPQPSYPGQPAPQPSYPGQPAPQPSPYPGQPAPQPSPYPGQPSGGNQNAGPGLVHIPPSPAGPSHPSNGAQYPSASIPSPTYSPPGNNYGRPGTNGIPIGGSIYDGAGRPPVTQAPQQPYTGPQNTTPHPGCAAALKCVPESYCTAEGVMANSPVTLTREQYENRVPLSDCADPDTGAIGKCCRDPNYKDPWPGGMMMMKGGNGGGAQLPQQQFPPQQPQNECGSSASCQHPYQCADHLRVQPTKNCRVPHDGASGVCCSNNQLPFPSGQPGGAVFPGSIPAQQKPHKKPTSGYPQPKPSAQPFPQPTPQQPFPQTSPSQKPYPQTSPSQQFPQTSPSQQPFPQKPNQPFPQNLPSSPYPQPKPSASPYPQPKPSASPYPQPKPSASPYPQPKPSASPFPQNKPSSHPFPQPTPSQQPHSHQPFPQTNPSQQPYPQPSPSNQPFPQTIPSQQSYPQTRPSQPSFPHTSQQPHHQTSPSQQQFPQTSPSQQTYPQKPSNQPFPQNFPSSPYPQSNPTASPQPKPSVQPFPSQQPQAFPTAQPSQPIPSAQPSPYPRPGKPIHSNQPQQPSSPNFPGSQQLPGQVSPTPGAECGIRRQVSRQGLADTDAGFSEFPWQALVVSSSDQKPLCSAVIISDRAVMTAAHCLQNLESNDIAVQAGVWKLNSLNPPKPSQTSHVAAISRHPKFDAGSLFNDLAVLVLSQPLKFDEHIDKICLPPKGQDISQLRGVCTATGWGKPAIQGNVPGSILHQIPVQLIPHNTCEEKLRQTHLGRYFILNPSFQCAVPAGPSQDLCKVDAGGPIACDRGDGHLMLSGLYSWDVGCSVPNSPTVLGGIDTDWIESVLARPVDDLVRDELNDILKQQQQEELGGVDIDNKPGFSQGYGKK